MPGNLIPLARSSSWTVLTVYWLVAVLKRESRFAAERRLSWCLFSRIVLEADRDAIYGIRLDDIK